jgi:hypothetical protein
MLLRQAPAALAVADAAGDRYPEVYLNPLVWGAETRELSGWSSTNMKLGSGVVLLTYLPAS